ncbi:hypothetical protein KOR42_48280 [Thalassoglobus neptunius]|uniref:Uncharacterized protein n=1 Tax=Thalassoglobus neptunius TaxID=1938619 RepID=A0A5C5VRS3_9PLAN|nr:hypothetical protein [Thalassoglobus neptunius]TWT41288.1 hypothetical protein KOR42_48280 [Thalassoglobus neptunius]
MVAVLIVPEFIRLVGHTIKQSLAELTVIVGVISVVVASPGSPATLRSKLN